MLGGMGWRVDRTAEYYRLLNEGVREHGSAACTQPASCSHSVDFAEIEATAGRRRLGRRRRVLADAGATAWRPPARRLLLLCTNTMHKVADQVQAAVSIPLLHLADTTAAARARRRTDARVGLLAHRVHDGAGLLPRPARRPRPATCSSPTPTTAPTSTGSSTTSCAAASSSRSRAQVYRRRDRPARRAQGRRASSWAAPRSSCSSAQRTARSRSSRPPGCTSRPPSPPR